MTRRLPFLLALAAVFLVAAQTPARAMEKSFPVITGENWVNATPQERLAFIAGLTTMIELEKEVQGPTPPADERSLIPGWVSGLSRFSLKEIVTALDDVYQKRPELKSRPVVEVLWEQVAYPQTGN